MDDEPRRFKTNTIITDGQQEPSDHLHTTAGSPHAGTSPNATDGCAQPPKPPPSRPLILTAPVCTVKGAERHSLIGLPAHP